MNKPVEVTAVFLSGAGGMGHAAVPVPLGRKIRGGDIPVPPYEPGNPPDAGEGLLELIEEATADLVGLGGGARWPVDREQM